MVYYFDKFSFLTPKQKKWMRENDIFANLLLFLSSIFEYDGLPESINADFIEFYNLLSPMGCCGVFEENGRLVLGYCTEGGMLDEYAQPVAFNINTLGLEHKEHVIDKMNGSICWNNSLHRNSLTLLNRFAEKFNLVDTAENCLAKFSRIFPIVKVDDSRMEKEINKAFNNSQMGEPFTIVDKGLTKLGVDKSQSIEMIQIGDYNAIDKMQYLSTYYNDLLRRFYQMFGMSIENSFKQAQQSIEEVTSGSIASWIIPEDMRKQRQKFIDSLNETFGSKYGFTASVKYSDAWSKGYKKYMESIDDTNNDIKEQEVEE